MTVTKLKHIVSVDQFDREFLETIFDKADTYKQVTRMSKWRRLDKFPDAAMFSLFWEASTRTKVSFHRAMHLLGGTVVGATDDADKLSSFSKGESIEDYIRVMEGYHPHAILMRTKEIGMAARAAEVSNIPIINAGDGTGEHPTQALLDLYTIFNELGPVHRLTVVFVGDLRNGRTVRSLAKLLVKAPVEPYIFFVAPDSLQVREDITRFLTEQQIWWMKARDLSEVAAHADILYMTRVQFERGSAVESASHYSLNSEILESMKPHARILHPLPRREEIPSWITSETEPRLACFRQSENGLYVRMAILDYLLS